MSSTFVIFKRQPHREVLKRWKPVSLVEADTATFALRAYGLKPRPTQDSVRDDNGYLFMAAPAASEFARERVTVL